MSLEDRIKELRLQRDAALEREEKEEEEALKALSADVQEEEQPEEPVEEAPKEEEKEPETPQEAEPAPKPEVVEPEEKLDNAGFARLRREAAAAKKRQAELEAQLEAIRNPAPQPQAQEAPQPVEQETVLPEPVQRLVERQLIEDASMGFIRFEEQLRRKGAADYDAVAKEYIDALGKSIFIQNPNLTESELKEQTKLHLLKTASDYMKQGYENPVEEMYHRAKEMGFTGAASAPAVEAEVKEEKQPKRPDLTKVAQNRQRSTNMQAAGGEGTTGITRAYIAQNGMPSPAEWAKMSPEQKRQLMYPAA